MAGLSDEAEVWGRWLSCPWVRDFERGRCDPPTFAAGVVADWGLTVEPEEFLASFAKWPIGLYDGALQTVTELRETGVAVGCLSKTNQVHFDEQTSWGLFHLFDYPSFSHQLGMLKPDREVFEHVLDTLGRRKEPASVLFVDDNQRNVDGARAAGLRAETVTGLAGARRALFAHRLL